MDPKQDPASCLLLDAEILRQLQVKPKGVTAQQGGGYAQTVGESIKTGRKLRPYKSILGLH